MRQNRDRFQPKPRPNGFSPNERPLQRRPNDRPSPNSNRPMQSSAPFKPRPRHAGPKSILPSQPASPKQRRRMLKAAAWRLAKIVHAKPVLLLTMEIPALYDLVEEKCPRKKAFEASELGNAMRLADKIKRLRAWTKAQDSKEAP